MSNQSELANYYSEYFDNYIFVKYEYYKNNNYALIPAELHILYNYLSPIKEKFEKRNDKFKNIWVQYVYYDDFDYSVMKRYIEKYNIFVEKMKMFDDS